MDSSAMPSNIFRRNDVPDPEELLELVCRASLIMQAPSPMLKRSYLSGISKAEAMISRKNGDEPTILPCQRSKNKHLYIHA